MCFFSPNIKSLIYKFRLRSLTDNLVFSTTKTILINFFSMFCTLVTTNKEKTLRFLCVFCLWRGVALRGCSRWRCRLSCLVSPHFRGITENTLNITAAKTTITKTFKDNFYNFSRKIHYATKIIRITTGQCYMSKVDFHKQFWF